MMVFLIVLTGTAVAWLWLFPLEGLSDRARRAPGWSPAGHRRLRVGDRPRARRDERRSERALTEYRRHEELKEREIRKIRDENDWRRGGVYN